MGPELVGDSLLCAPAREQIGIGLDIVARVGEHQIVPTTQAPVQMVGDLVVCQGPSAFDGRILGFHPTGCQVATQLQHQPSPVRLRLHYRHLPRVVRAEEGGGAGYVAEGGGQPDTRWSPPDRQLDPMQQRPELGASLGGQEAMKFVDYDVAQPGQQARNDRTPVDEDGLQGLGGHHQHPGRCRHHLPLRSRRHVAMPAVYGHVNPSAEVFEALVLVVDQRLQRRDVQDLHADFGSAGRCRSHPSLVPCANARSVRSVPLHGVRQVRQDRQEGGFGLSGGRRRRDEHIAIAVEYGVRGAFLGVVQRGPALVVDPALYPGMQPGESRGFGRFRDGSGRGCHQRPPPPEAMARSLRPARAGEVRVRLRLDIHPINQLRPLRAGVLVEHRQQVHELLDGRARRPEISVADPRRAVAHESLQSIVGH